MKCHLKLHIDITLHYIIMKVCPITNYKGQCTAAMLPVATITVAASCVSVQRAAGDLPGLRHSEAVADAAATGAATTHTGGHSTRRARTVPRYRSSSLSYTVRQKKRNQFFFCVHLLLVLDRNW